MRKDRPVLIILICFGFSIVVTCLSASPDSLQKYIMVDQFGYHLDDVKIAILVDPQQGYNSGDTFTPGAIYQIRDWDADTVVFSDSIHPWNNGTTQTQSGDRGWWFDFSSVTLEGSYYVYDVENNLGSHKFEIRDDVYYDVLKAAVRMFFYNRCGCEKVEPYAHVNWVDGAAFLGPQQDTEARDVHDQGNPASEKDLQGGWFDAGDYNKYVTFTEPTIHLLLDAYTLIPEIWTDDFNIPESGNTIPDFLDEIMWELDWVKRMQDTDGGVHIKCGVIHFYAASPPSADTSTRFYEIKCSSSTIAAAGMFAHAALVLSEFSSLSGYVDDLRVRAELAWDWFHSHPMSADCDSQIIKAGDADRSIDDQEEMAVTAAVYLFALTEETEYDQYVMDNYTVVDKLSWWGPYEMDRGSALLYYTTLPLSDSATVVDILSQKVNCMNYMTSFYRQNDDLDLYRSYMPDDQYHWGSNQVKANVGNINYEAIQYNLDPPNNDQYIDRALASIHYLHGVNPQAMVYLSNMYSYDADSSANEIYHSWFADGTEYDNALTSPKGPAPGYVTGGPNKDYSGSVTPPAGQPPQKSYLDWNTGYPDNSWEITEPGIYYQAAYIKLLAGFISEVPSGVAERTLAPVPEKLTLQVNAVNPFHQVTTIRFQLSTGTVVDLSIYDVTGAKVKTLIHGYCTRGTHTFSWNGKSQQNQKLASGVYFVRLSAGTLQEVKKAVFLRGK
jgi:endoglucanase